MADMRARGGVRAERKAAARARILASAAARLREAGPDGVAINTVMRDAQLTHGGFYAHFKDKQALVQAALVHALADTRRRWMGRAPDASWPARLERLARRYINPAHRDHPADACALAALTSDAARAGPALQATYAAELTKTLEAIAAPFAEAPEAERARLWDEALAFMALSVGSVALARAVGPGALSDQILRAGRRAAARINTAPKESPR